MSRIGLCGELLQAKIRQQNAERKPAQPAVPAAVVTPVEVKPIDPAQELPESSPERKALEILPDSDLQALAAIRLPETTFARGDREKMLKELVRVGATPGDLNVSAQSPIHTSGYLSTNTFPKPKVVEVVVPAAPPAPAAAVPLTVVPTTVIQPGVQPAQPVVPTVLSAPVPPPPPAV
jgi:hypothetical protein